jgi:hypothetical protein
MTEVFKYPTPKKDDVWEETEVQHQPRQFKVSTGKVEEYEDTVARIGLRRIKPNGLLGNTMYMYSVKSLEQGQGMKLVERDARQAEKATIYCVTREEFEAAVKRFFPEAECDWSNDQGGFVVSDGTGVHLGWAPVRCWPGRTR